MILNIGIFLIITPILYGAARGTRSPEGRQVTHAMPYSFGYTVDAPEYQNYHDRVEESDGLLTKGRWRVALPDNRLQTVTYTAGKDGFEAQISYEPHPNFKSLRASLGKPEIGQSVVDSLFTSQDNLNDIPTTPLFDEDVAASSEVYTFGSTNNFNDIGRSNFENRPTRPSNSPFNRHKTNRPSTRKPVHARPLNSPARIKIQPTRMSKIVTNSQTQQTPTPQSARQGRLHNNNIVENPFAPKPTIASRINNIQNFESLRSDEIDDSDLQQLYIDLQYPSHIISNLPVTYDQMHHQETISSPGAKPHKKYSIRDRDSVIQRLQAIVHKEDLNLVTNNAG